MPPSAIKMEAPIPITIPISYDTYASYFSQGLLADCLSGTICPRYPHDCPSPGPPPILELTNSTISRTAFVLEVDDEGIDIIVERKLDIVLAKCPICKGRCRVLPADILPYKRYSLPVIGCSLNLYNRGDLSLRKVVWERLYGERTPEPNTLHGWTEGFGAWCLGRTTGEVAFSVPATRVVAELQAHYPQMNALLPISVRIDPRRYRSQGRKERLEACKRFQIIGTLIEGRTDWKLSEINRLIVTWGSSFGLGFRTGMLSTVIEHIDSTDVPTWPPTVPKEPLPCPIRGRSPPFDTR